MFSVDEIALSSVVSVVVGGIVYFLRAIATRKVENTLNNRFLKDAEQFRSDLRVNEERFRSEISAKQSQIADLRELIVTGIASRRSIVFDRQVRAIENVWSAFMDKSEAKALSGQMLYVNFEKAASETPHRDDLREMFRKLNEHIDLSKFRTEYAYKERPFVNDIIWAYFKAYDSIIGFSIAKAKILETGVEDGPRLLDFSGIERIVKLALPDKAELLERKTPDFYHILLEDIEERALKEMKRFLSGEELRQEELRQAREVIQSVEAYESQAT